MKKVQKEEAFLLKPVLQRLGVSQRALARLMEVPQNHVNRWACGRQMPSWDSACDIADALGVSVGVFRVGDVAHAEFFSPQSEEET